MKATKLFITVSALCAGVIVINTLSAVVSANQDPKVTIKKSVQNQTTNSPVSEANDAATAVSAKPGDVLKYVIELTNNADAAEANKNDFRFAKLIDALPGGLALVSDADKREINEDLGTLAPGKTITKQYLIKVTADKDGEVLENKACFTGQYDAKDKPQSDCEPAFVKVSNPAKQPETPATPVTPAPVTPAPQTETLKPTQPPAPANTEALPTTGPADALAPLAAVGVGALSYAGRLFLLKRRD